MEEKGIDKQGIFRVSGNGKRIAQLLVDFDTPTSYGLGQYVLLTSPFECNNVFDIADCLKKFFRGLSEPLFTKTLYPYFLQSARIPY
jgi:hypothetical protein